MGRPAIESLNLVTGIEPIVTADKPMTKDLVIQEYPSLFGKLGKLQGSYHIKLKEQAVPFSLNSPRQVAIPLLPKGIRKNGKPGGDILHRTSYSMVCWHGIYAKTRQKNSHMC